MCTEEYKKNAPHEMMIQQCKSVQSHHTSSPFMLKQLIAVCNYNTYSEMTHIFGTSDYSEINAIQKNTRNALASLPRNSHFKMYFYAMHTKIQTETKCNATHNRKKKKKKQGKAYKSNIEAAFMTCQ